MPHIIEDGTGTGSKLRIDSHNRLYSFAVSETEDRHINTENGKVWSYYAKVTPAAANDIFFYLKNTGPNPIHITDIRICSTVASEILYKKVTGTPIYISATDAPALSRNFGSSYLPEAVAKYDTDITGLTTAGIIFNEFIESAGKIHHLRTSSNIIVPQSSSFAIERVEATGEITVVVSIVEVENIL